MSQPEDFEARAIAAEDDVIYMRRCLTEYIKWLASPERGPVIFRFEVVERLREILAP